MASTLDQRLLELADRVGGSLLGLDSSGSMSSVCCVSSDRVEQRISPAAAIPSETLVQSLADVMDRCGVSASQLRALVVGIGPGSFTGLRVALATAKGIALGAGVPLYGISSAAMLAASAWTRETTGLVAYAADVRRGELYSAAYSISPGGDAEIVLGDAARTPEGFASELREHRIDLFIGDAADALVELAGFTAAPVAPEPEMRVAFGLLHGGERILAGDSDSLSSLTPSYLRLSEAERKANAES